MPRQSPAVLRTVSILNFFVEHPRQSFTLTQLANSLHISRATCHTLLQSLTDTDYLYRTPDKSYVLGPTLISLGVSALENFSPLTIARHEIRALADELDVVVSVMTMEDNTLTIRDRAASRTHIGWLIPTPRSYPIVPYGSVFLISQTDSQLQFTLDAMKPPLSPGDREQVYKAVRFGRKHQFVVALTPQGLENLPTWTPNGDFVEELPQGGSYHIRFISAPIFDQRGRIQMALALYGFNEAVPYDRIMKIAEHLHVVCARMQKFTHAGHGE